jgi:hypothetical protein
MSAESVFCTHQSSEMLQAAKAAGQITRQHHYAKNDVQNGDYSE